MFYILHAQIDDLDDLILSQRREYDDLIDTVEEFRTEVLLRLILNLLFHIGINSAVLTDPVDQIVASDVGRHDHDGILEVHSSSLVVGQTTIVQQLQQNVEHVRMSLFDFIEQYNAVRLPPYGFRQLTAFIIANISRRRSDKSGDGVFLHVFGHIDTDHVLF